MASVKRLTNEQEWRKFYPVVEDFWPAEDANEYVAYLRRMTDQGYEPFGMYTDEAVSFAGLYMLHCPWYDEFAWLLDLVTRPDRRGEGHGSVLYNEVKNWALEQGCETIVLASGADRERTHEFYERHNYEMTEYWFERPLS